MKLTKKRGDTGTIRKVWNNEKTECYGLVGTIGDLLNEGIFDYCDASTSTWAYIPRRLADGDPDSDSVIFADSMQAALSEAQTFFSK